MQTTSSPKGFRVAGGSGIGPLLLIGVAILCGLLSRAAAAENELEISGLLADRTSTGFGRDFYRFFSASWRPPPEIGGYNIVITEKTTPQAGTWIWIKVNNIIAHRVLIGRRRADIEKIARAAAAVIAAHVISRYGKGAHGRVEYDLAGDGL